jgi:hypothetical protein
LQRLVGKIAYIGERCYIHNVTVILPLAGRELGRIGRPSDGRRATARAVQHCVAYFVRKSEASQRLWQALLEEDKRFARFQIAKDAWVRLGAEVRDGKFKLRRQLIDRRGRRSRRWCPHTKPGEKASGGEARTKRLIQRHGSSTVCSGAWSAVAAPAGRAESMSQTAK